MLQCMIYTGPGYRVRIYDIKPKQVQHVLSTTDDQLEPLKLDYFVKSWRSKSKGYLLPEQTTLPNVSMTLSLYKYTWIYIDWFDLNIF